jgi:DNA repair/transcription protein MET18/MMS19
MAVANVRDYLMVVENDKVEALRIAERSGQSLFKTSSPDSQSAYTSSELQCRESTLLDIVQSLGEYINDEDSRIRGRAVSYLAAVLSTLPPKFLSRQQIDVLCQFFSDRIEDGGAVEGLTKLQSLDRFTNEMAQTVVRA